LLLKSDLSQVLLILPVEFLDLEIEGLLELSLVLPLLFLAVDDLGPEFLFNRFPVSDLAEMMLDFVLEGFDLFLQLKDLRFEGVGLGGVGGGQGLDIRLMLLGLILKFGVQGITVAGQGLQFDLQI
jgi:hypothetical protein